MRDVQMMMARGCLHSSSRVGFKPHDVRRLSTGWRGRMLWWALQGELAVQPGVSEINLTHAASADLDMMR